MDERDKLTDPVEEALSKISGGRVLDVATGSGGFINFLMENLKDYTEITGIDSSIRPLEAARQAYPLENIHFLPMDAVRMNFANGQFDTVCIANSLHHLADLSGALVEMMRVCKPGGYFIINEMYRDDQSETQLTHVFLHHWWAAVDTAQGITHLETFTRGHIVEIVDKLGLHNLKQFDQKDLDADPKDPDLIGELDNIIDRYIQRVHGLDGGNKLCQQGEQLRHRLHKVGFHGATTLFVIGEK